MPRRSRKCCFDETLSLFGEAAIFTIERRKTRDIRFWILRLVCG